MPHDETTKAVYAPGKVRVVSPSVTYAPDGSSITSTYTYTGTEVHVDPSTGDITATPTHQGFVFHTDARVPKTGVMIVGWGGNNGTTITAALLAHQHGLTWRTKSGVHTPDYLGSLTQAATVRLGSAGGRDVYVPFASLLPMVHPTSLVVGGWDISALPLGAGMERAQVLDWDLQAAVRPHMDALGAPLPSIYYPDYIAANQADRAGECPSRTGPLTPPTHPPPLPPSTPDNLLCGGSGTKAEHLATIRGQIRAFKATHGLDKVIVLWSANTERFSDVRPGLNMTAGEVLASIQGNESEVAPSAIFAVASILEGCSYINGSPQNTFVPGIIELAVLHRVFIGGDDFKSGQTKMKSVLTDFLVSAGLKPTSIVSYNHLGNNDGKNLSAPSQFRSKEISKSNVVDDMVASNPAMYAGGGQDGPDHAVVIKYVPAVGDSKRALDEYTSSIFMGGSNTIVLHNTCEDSLLAAPLILDLVLLTELFERVRVRREGEEESASARLHPVLSLLSYCLKAPLVPPGTPVINALFKQREALVNTLRAAIGLQPEHHMLLEHRLASAGSMPVRDVKGGPGGGSTPAVPLGGEPPNA